MENFSGDVFEAMDMAEIQYPIAWYERQWIHFWIYAVTAFLIFLLQVNLFRAILNIWLSGFVFAMLILGQCADIYSTIWVMRLKPIFDRKKLDFPVAETNSTLPEHPTFSDFINRKQVAILLGMSILASVVPAIGFGIAASKLGVVLNNLRRKDRLVWILEMIEGRFRVEYQKNGKKFEKVSLVQ